MRILVIAILVAAIGWAAYWFIGSSAQERSVNRWLEQQQNAGWVANSSNVNVRGFPNRFDTIISDLEIADPNSGWAWSAPEMQFLMLSYKPNHIIAQWPQAQTVSTPNQNITVDSAEISASVVFRANTALALERFTASLDDVKLISNQDWNSHIQSAILAMRRTDASEFSYDIAFDALGFTPPSDIKAGFDKSGILPETFQTVSVSTTAHYDAQWDRLSVEGNLPTLTKLDITDGRAVWGGLELQGTGSLAIDAQGYPTGKLTVRAKNWKDMIKLAQENGAIDAGLARKLETGLGLIAMLAGNQNTLDVPLSFANRMTSIGPIPIGPAPQIRRPRLNN
ncbi:hypothetical protein GCM10008927_16550 [Amylibacter ulvae]|uniref:DUF2125 domain-containing protein n=1 Tax=Paramylibacter ulvae TaxID=1651968 RepID=A0ABQ3CZX2_9RHOB|nr:DUF2125 domain-containing protein [Amylibacter ulvae]GHA51766.1 hypothetical protein GCM10008927_16550 [Amylibacter ulvae]